MFISGSAYAGRVSLDTTFNGTGYSIQFISSEGAIGESVAIQPDGKIVLGGWTQSVAVWGSFAIMRLNQNGSLDSGFDSDGFAITTVTNFNRGDTVKLRTDGKSYLPVFRPSDSTWYSNQTAGSVSMKQFGLPSDRPVLGRFLP